MNPQDPREPGRFDFDPFAQGVQGPPSFGTGAKGPAAPRRTADHDHTGGFGPPWLLPAVAGALALLFVAVLVWLTFARGDPGPEAGLDTLPTISAPEAPARLAPPPSVQATPDPSVATEPESLLVGEAEQVRAALEAGQGPQIVPQLVEAAPPAVVPAASEVPVSVPDIVVAQAQERATEATPPLSLVPPAPASASALEAPAPEASVPPEPPPARPQARSVSDADAMATAALASADRRTPTQAAQSNTGPYYVQMGSVTNAENAAKEVLRLRDAYVEVFGKGSSWRVVPVDLGPQGTFHRIQAGPYAEGEARAICDQIKAKTPGACVVMR